MNFIIVNKLHCNGNGTYSEGEDYSFLNPQHIVSIESLRREVMKYDEEFGYKRPSCIFVYKVTLIENRYLFCTVENREALYERITGQSYLSEPV